MRVVCRHILQTDLRRGEFLREAKWQRLRPEYEQPGVSQLLKRILLRRCRTNGSGQRNINGGLLAIDRRFIVGLRQKRMLTIVSQASRRSPG
jgi:hypothetical protein